MTGTMVRAFTNADARVAAEAAGVCVRPVLSRVTDITSGEARIVAMDCKSTQAAVCPACAERARRVRMQQCREGWHRDDEPDLDPTGPHLDDFADEDLDVSETDDHRDEGVDDGGEDDGRRHRSTRRRDDVADLPRVPMEARTVGTAFTGRDGRQYRPSMFLTLTLPSYGPVRRDGTPVKPTTYEYRRAAWDAMTFGRLLDRFFQNLRRCAGYEVQYFAAVEPQRRGAPHAHIAIRGALPRSLIRALTAATYTQVWWPSCDHETHDEGSWPVWDHHVQGFIDPATGAPLPTWTEALRRVDGDPRSRPAHVARFGTQLDMQGLLGGTEDSDRAVRYLTKYLAKSMSDPMTGDPMAEDDPDAVGDRGEVVRRQIHAERLHAHTSRLPCSATCANWLRYGVQPRGATSETMPGRCRSKAHQRSHLGYGGRRVLVSRKWSGKTLAAHRADRAAVVRAVLQAAGIDPDDHAELSATTPGTDDVARYHWTRVAPGSPDAPTYQRAIATSIRRRHRWRAEYDRAKQTLCGPVTPLAPFPITSLPVVLGSGVQGERSESAGHEVPWTPGARATPSPIGDGAPNPMTSDPRRGLPEEIHDESG